MDRYGWRCSARAWAAIATGALLLLGACGGGGDGAGAVVTNPPPITVGAVTVALPATTLRAGDALKATAEVRSTAGGVLTGRAIAWTSSNAAVATVSSAGQVTGVAAGSAIITATADGVSGSATLTVTSPPVGTIAVTTPSAQLSITRSMTAAVVVRDDRNVVLTGRALTWTSSDAAVATVDGTGLITAIALGSTTITASAEGKSGSVSITVVPHHF